MKTKLLSMLGSFTEPYLPPSEVLDVPPPETASPIAIRLLYKNPAVTSTSYEK